MPKLFLRGFYSHLSQLFCWHATAGWKGHPHGRNQLITQKGGNSHGLYPGLITIIELFYTSQRKYEILAQLVGDWRLLGLRCSEASPARSGEGSGKEMSSSSLERWRRGGRAPNTSPTRHLYYQVLMVIIGS